VPSASSSWSSVYLPGRNLLLLSQAGVFCSLHRVSSVAQGLLKGNPFADATPRFRRAMAGAVNAALGGRIKIMAPYSRLSKIQVLNIIPGFPFELTFSCLKPRGKAHCGACNKCEERRAALTPK